MSESIDISSLCEWSEGKHVKTKAGPRWLQTAAPSEAFRELWKTRKDELKAAGLGWSKGLGGEWEVCWWQPDPDESDELVISKEESPPRDEFSAAENLPAATLEKEPVLPTALELRPYLDKILAAPGSAVILGIELWGGQWRVARAWLNPEERQVLRKALEKVNIARAKAGEAPTTEESK